MGKFVGEPRGEFRSVGDSKGRAMNLASYMSISESVTQEHVKFTCI